MVQSHYSEKEYESWPWRKLKVKLVPGLRPEGSGHKQEDPRSPDSMGGAGRCPKALLAWWMPLGLGGPDVFKDQKGLARTFSRKSPGVITATRSSPSKLPGSVSTCFNVNTLQKTEPSLWIVPQSRDSGVSCPCESELLSQG